MMGGNPNWWTTSLAEQPQTWSQFVIGEEHRVFNQPQMTHYHPTKLENFQHQIFNNNPNFAHLSCNTNNPHHRSNRVVSGGGGGAPDPDRSLESNRSAVVDSGACKKARVHPPSSTQPPLKTDTASVLSEAIGYIRFLRGQIEALSYPYLRSAPKELTNSQPLGDERKRQEKPLKELRSRGLCLVPLSCTHLVGADTTYGTGF